jgi:hypothetical protein
MIYLSVRLVALDVLITIFDRSKAEDDEKWKDDETGGDGGELVEELEDGNGKEKAVGRR